MAGEAKSLFDSWSREELVAEVIRLRSLLATSPQPPQPPPQQPQPQQPQPQQPPQQPALVGAKRYADHSLTAEQVRRYSRHLLLPQVGVRCQERICGSSVLVIGAGGLGAPVCLYLAAAGVGRLGIVDHDLVDRDNLHRQVIHSELTLGLPKAESARDACLRLNPSVKCEAYVRRFESSWAMSVVQQYDVLVDCSDNVATRYLINDAAVLCGKPLVSGSALRLEGQVTVYHHKGGPCYRCIFPKPPPPEAVTNCSDGGVFGVVPGIIGCVQAMEILKICGGMDESPVTASVDSKSVAPLPSDPQSQSQSSSSSQLQTQAPAVVTLSQRLFMFDAARNYFGVVRLRGRSSTCAVCGDQPSVTSLIDYNQFCSMPSHDGPPMDTSIDPNVATLSIPAKEFAQLVGAVDGKSDGQAAVMRHVLLDVREPVQFDICRLLQAVNIPLSQLRDRMNELVDLAKLEQEQQQQQQQQEQGLDPHTDKDKEKEKDPPQRHLPIFVVCRRGIDSVRATRLLRNSGLFDSSLIRNIRGGLLSWTKYVDPNFPTY